MNLISAAWIPIVRKDGKLEKIAPWQIAEIDNPVMEIVAARHDFKGALYQLLIGLLQTVFSPEDPDQWFEYWQQNPEPHTLKSVFEEITDAFDFTNVDGPAFLQDLDLPESELKPLSALLIDAPGEKTLKDNLDHFVKGGSINGVCGSCCATALFTLQANAPAGGAGHRVGLRGGGPLTTLLLPESADSTLWQKLWLNVLSQESFPDTITQAEPSVFPWMANTRVSDKKGMPTFPEDVSPLQMYWGMPRRIRIDTQTEPGDCTLCGEFTKTLYSHFRTKNNGVNYDGAWQHPLTPYRFDPKKKSPPLSIKGQQGGLGYRHWLGLMWIDDGGSAAAQVTKNFYENLAELIEDEGDSIAMRLWCFGYDMDNMKARCWYEHQLPVISVSQAYSEYFVAHVSRLLSTAQDVVKVVNSQVKAAWFNRPKDVKGNTSMVGQSFWQATESLFYQQLYVLAKEPDDLRHMPRSVAEQWMKGIRYAAYEIFDHWVLEGNAEDLNMKRITSARRELSKKLKNTKSLKDLDQIAQSQEVV
ncbi:MAG: type I-E CRISPR-associated protein Cse1/CasA [Pseudomonadales bacterium]|nr:type I-E CRISPR-associated protein Cse1/CasA [Pseudomonadales bacterium]